MNFIWGIILINVTLKCWIGQIIISFSPKVAAKIRIIEPESNVDPAYFADTRGEAIWDVMSLQTLLVAGILLIINNPLWAYFGLVGGGMYLYSSGRGIVSHLTMQRRGKRIGRIKNLKVKYIFLTLHFLIAIVTIIMAVATFTL